VAVGVPLLVYLAQDALIFHPQRDAEQESGVQEALGVHSKRSASTGLRRAALRAG
jgi:hypothetical protein